jgi:hypothetical protein
MTLESAISAQPWRGAADRSRMMTLNKAKGLALESLAIVTGRPASELLIVDELTQCRRTGWIFFYETRAFLEHGHVALAIGRTGPVVVTHAGAVHHLDGERPVDDVLREFEAIQRRAPPRVAT